MLLPSSYSAASFITCATVCIAGKRCRSSSSPSEPFKRTALPLKLHLTAHAIAANTKPLRNKTDISGSAKQNYDLLAPSVECYEASRGCEGCKPSYTAFKAHANLSTSAWLHVGRAAASLTSGVSCCPEL